MNWIHARNFFGGLGLTMHVGCGAPEQRIESPPVLKVSAAEKREAVIPGHGNVILAVDQTVNGVFFSAGSSLDLRHGQLSTFVLGRDQDVQGIHLPRAAFGTFRQVEGAATLYSVELPKDWVIQGSTYYSAKIYFHPNHNLAFGTLASGDVIDGIPCAGENTVEFHDNRRLKAGILRQNFPLNGIPLPKGASFHLEKDGKLISVMMSHVPGGWPIHGRSYIFANFYPDDKVMLGELSKDETIDNIPCAGRDTVEYHPNGKLKAANLAADHRLKGVRGAFRGTLWDKGSFIQLDDAGNVTLIGLSKKKTLRGTVFDKGSVLDFEKGVWKSAWKPERAKVPKD